jgi:hypothetical protein
VDNSGKRKIVRLAFRILTSKNIVSLDRDELSSLGFSDYYEPTQEELRMEALDILYRIT